MDIEVGSNVRIILSEKTDRKSTFDEYKSCIGRVGKVTALHAWNYVTYQVLFDDDLSPQIMKFTCDEIELVLRKRKYNIGDTVIIKNISGYCAEYEKLFKPYINTKAKILRYSKQDEFIRKGFEDYIYVLDIKNPIQDGNIYISKKMK